MTGPSRDGGIKLFWGKTTRKYICLEDMVPNIVQMENTLMIFGCFLPTNMSGKRSKQLDKYPRPNLITVSTIIMLRTKSFYLEEEDIIRLDIIQFSFWIAKIKDGESILLKWQNRPLGRELITQANSSIPIWLYTEVSPFLIWI